MAEALFYSSNWRALQQYRKEQFYDSENQDEIVSKVHSPHSPISHLYKQQGAELREMLLGPSRINVLIPQCYITARCRTVLRAGLFFLYIMQKKILNLIKDYNEGILEINISNE